LVFFFFQGAIVSGAQETSLTLEEALNISLRDNRDILLKYEDIRKAKATIAEADASLFPTVSFTGGWTDTRDFYSKDIGVTSNQLTVKQYLYQGGKTVNTIAQKKDALKVSEALLDAQKLELIQDVTRGFYTLLLAQEYRGLNTQIVDNARAHITMRQARYRSGQVSSSDLLAVQKSLGAVEEAYAASENQVEAGQALLRKLLYLEDEVSIYAQGDFVVSARDIAYDEAFLKAMRSRPEIRQYEAQAQADTKAIEIAKADTRPSIYASWDYYTKSHFGAGASKNWNDYNVLGITFSWPIFDGWATKAKVEQAMVDLRETQLLRQQEVKNIALELKNAYLNLKNAIASIKAVESEVEMYRDTLVVMQVQFKSGIVSLLEVEDAALGYQVSLFKQKEALYDYIVAKASFDRATGGI